MAMIDATTGLAGLFAVPVPLRQVEPGLFSVYAPDDRTNAYDGAGALALYDLVACNRFYNRLVWGYWPSVFDAVCRRALVDGGPGWVLDAGCGSLAFTARAHAACRQRPVVCLDQSLRLLRLARKRLLRHAGGLPDNVVFLHADALAMPFADRAFATVTAFNLLHVVADAPGLVRELSRVARPGANLVCTTLVRAERLADRYLEAWGRAGELVPRSLDDVRAVFTEASLTMTATVHGNMAFLESRV